MPVRGAARRPLTGIVALTLALSSGLLAACSSASDEPERLDDWHSVTLPEAMAPSTLVLTDDALLIGGSRPDGSGRAPALAALPLDRTGHGPLPVPVTPATPYGKVADLRFLTGSPDGRTVVAVGAAHGGAHANSRWTIWKGSSDRLVDRPQTFETFGGWEAGTLLGVATDGKGPLVVGTWQGAYGSDGAVWRADGDRWVREPPAPTLTNTRQRQVAPQTVSQTGDAVVVNGSIIDLTDGVHQSATSWRDLDGAWSMTVLPDPGSRSLAWSTACASTCWTAGARDGTLAVWSEAGLSALPSVPVEDADSAQVVVGGDQVVVVASSGGAGRMLIGAGDHWRGYTAPDGVPRAAALVGTELYLVSGTDTRRALWMRDLADVLAR